MGIELACPFQTAFHSGSGWLQIHTLSLTLHNLSPVKLNCSFELSCMPIMESGDAWPANEKVWDASLELDAGETKVLGMNIWVPIMPIWTTYAWPKVALTLHVWADSIYLGGVYFADVQVP